jgi:hypothetical protein
MLKWAGHSCSAAGSHLGHCYHIPVLGMWKMVAGILTLLAVQFRKWVHSTAGTDVLWKHDTPL